MVFLPGPQYMRVARSSQGQQLKEVQKCPRGLKCLNGPRASKIQGSPQMLQAMI